MPQLVKKIRQGFKPDRDFCIQQSVILKALPIKSFSARILLFFASNIFTKFPINNFTSRLIDKLIIASGK